MFGPLEARVQMGRRLWNYAVGQKKKRKWGRRHSPVLVILKRKQRSERERRR